MRAVQPSRCRALVLIALLLALGSSLAYGCADFLGGLGARKAHVWPFLGASLAPAALAWGAASGVVSAAAFALLYRMLAIGPMNVLFPITVLVSAILPVGVGLVQGEHLGADRSAAGPGGRGAGQRRERREVGPPVACRAAGLLRGGGHRTATGHLHQAPPSDSGVGL
ncbi:hypothetical protein GCM10010095_82110 [Streptomyces anthocyanicus]|nr:hypothetical protein GCM10010095_82110 [Streptomyces anthocyanicus]